VRERFAVPVRDWLSQAWALARTAEPRAPLSRRAILTDIAIAAVALVASLFAVRSTYAGQPAQFAVDPHTGAVVVVGVTQIQQVWKHAALAILFTSLPLAARRRFPLSAFAVLLAGTLATQRYATDVTFLAIVLAGYSAVAYSRFRGAALLSMIPAGLIVATSYWNASPSNLSVGAVPVSPTDPGFLKSAGVTLQTGEQWRVPGLVAAFSLVLIAVIGNAMQARDRIRRMRAEHAAATRRALDEERALIASELHDVVTHNVSVMIVQAGAARQVLAADPAEATAALLAVEASGRAAMTELRHLLGLLSPVSAGAGPAGPAPAGPAPDGAEAGQDLSPQPGLGQLQPLIDRLATAGLPVELQVGGAPRALPPGLDLAAYRVVQEALTNVLKHAGKPRTTVRLDYAEAELVVEVADAGRPIPAAGPAAGAVPGSGRGLLGLRERIALYGGELDAGPRPVGGWLVRARLPVDPAASAAAGQPAAGLASPAAGQR
jgi:signal transduction histidine kinase